MSELAEAFRDFTLNTNSQQVFGCSFIFWCWGSTYFPLLPIIRLL